MSNKSKNIIRGVLIAFTTVTFIACGKSDKDVVKDKKQTENKIVIDSTKIVADGKYFCPMHPLEQSNEPGAKCPVCRMNMISKADYNKEMMDKHEALEDKYQGKKDAIHFEVNLSVIKSEECDELIKIELEKDPGILGYSIDILNSVVHMYIDKTKTSKSKVEKLIADLGFNANNTKANPDAAAKLPADCK
jgi:Heavy metal binding domain